MSDSANKKELEKDVKELKDTAAKKAKDEVAKKSSDAKKSADKKAKKGQGKIAAFFKEYRSELKKISWPTFQEVVKNSVITLIVCLIVGAVIWLADWGLDTLRTLIIGGKKEAEVEVTPTDALPSEEAVNGMTVENPTVVVTNTDAPFPASPSNAQ